MKEPAKLIWEPGPELFGVELVRGVSIPMSDGVELTADVAYPTDPATDRRAEQDFPVILIQMPYISYVDDKHQSRLSKHIAGFGSSSYLTNRFFVSRGYISVVAQVRGTCYSGGQFGFLSEREIQDGVELVDWVASHLDGSNGRVALTGTSYCGRNQLLTAARLPKGSPVRAIRPGAAADFFSDYFFSGGVPTNAARDILPSWGPNMASKSASEFFDRCYDDMHAGGELAYNGDFWQQRSIANIVDKIVNNEIPTLLWSGWSDASSSTALDLFAMFQNCAQGRDAWELSIPGSAADPRYQLIMGPDTAIHDPARHQAISKEVTLKWFDTWLKDRNTGMLGTTHGLHLYESGTSRWVDAAHYPLTNEPTNLYLHPGGRLSGQRSVDEGPDSERLEYLAPNHDNATLVYTTDPFPDGATLAGPMSMDVYASSSNTNLFLIAEVFDVAPDGKETKLTSGALLGSLRSLDARRSLANRDGVLIRPRHAFDRDAYLTPGEITELNIYLRPRLADLPAGHRLRLMLRTGPAVGDCGPYAEGPIDDFVPRPCAPTKPQAESLDGGTYRIHFGGMSASRLNVPLQPYMHYPTSSETWESVPDSIRVSVSG